MHHDENVTTRLWIDKHLSHNGNPPAAKHGYKSKKKSLTASEVKLINQFAKNNKSSWEVILNAAFSIFLSKFSTNDDIIYGKIIKSLDKKSKSTIAIQPVQIHFKRRDTTNTILHSIAKELSKSVSQKKNSRLIHGVRYLLSSNRTPIKSNNSEINPYIYPLIVQAGEKPSIPICVYYDGEHIDSNAAKSILDHLFLSIRTLMTDKSLRFDRVSLLTKDESKLILSQWNFPKYDFKTPTYNNKTPHEIIKQVSHSQPNTMAVTFKDKSLSYRELDELSDIIAKNLIAKGITQGEHVCVYMERSPEWILVMLAILKSGAIYVPINPKFPDERIDHVISDTKAKFIIANRLEQLPSKFHHHVVVADDDLILNNKSHHFKLNAISPDDIAYIIYTSGTTGKPKGVMIKHKSLTNLIAWYQGCFKINKQDRSAQFASQGFDSHLCEIIPFLASGASIYIVDDNTKLTPSLFFNWISSNQITVCDLPTAYAQILLGMEWPNSSSLRLMKIGGEMLTHYPARVLPFDIWNGYGPTETTIESVYFQVAHANHPHQVSDHHTSPPIGKPIVNFEAYVVDHYLQPVAIGVVGELLIGGEYISSGYLNRDDLTLQRFIPNPFNPSKYPVYRTGDLVRWMPDGNLEYIGRIDNQIKIRGYRIELSDIENSLYQHPDVKKAIVIVKEGVNHHKTLVAYHAPDLDKARYIYQERCLLSVDDKYIEVITEDISKNGLALSGVTDRIPIGKPVKMQLKLPGINDPKQLQGRLIWQQDNRCGVAFDMPDTAMSMVAKSVEFYLSTHNVMELVLNTSAKRSLRKSLKSKLPEYMVPTDFVTIMQFPLTFSGKIDVKSLPPPHETSQLLRNEYIAPKSPTEKLVANIWSELLHVEKISMNDNFFDLGGSSLTAAQLSVRILNQFNISIPAKILFDLSYVPILSEYIDTKGSTYSSHTVMQEDIERDLILSEHTTPTKILSPTAEHPQNILLTGAGGFLGVFLLRELLNNTQAKIHCLVRKGEFESAAMRLISTIQKYHLEQEISLSDKRIIVIASDLAYDNFGLPLEHYNSLLEKIDLIYHCGAQVNIMASYNKLRGSNVQGTLEVIKFATKRYDKPIHYISTLSSAYMKDEAGNLAEVFPNSDHKDLFGGYAISKWVSERLLTEAKLRGLPVAIYRSGYISGDASTGIANLNDALFMLIKGCIQLGIAPVMEEKITILPVDYVSKAITMIALTNPTISNVYHIDHPTGIMWSDLIAWMNDYGYSVKMVSMREWQEKLSSITQDNALFAFLPYYLSLPEDFYSPNVRVDNAKIALEKLKLPYPAIDDLLLQNYFDHMLKMNFLPKPDNIKRNDRIKT